MALLRMIFFKDPEMIGLSYEKQLMTKSAAFQNMYYIANQASQDFNIANTLVNGLFTWDIPALNIWMNASRNLWSTMNDDDLTMLEKFIVAPTKSFGIFKPFRPYAEALVRD